MARRRGTTKRPDEETQSMSREVEEREGRFYPGIRNALQSYFCSGSVNCLFEVTAEGISDKLQGELGDEILFLLRSRELRPDILGHVEHPVGSKAFYFHEFFVAAEVKEGSPTINDLFQAKKYGEIYEAAVTLLVSNEKPEERVVRLLKRRPVLLHLPMSMHSVYLCKFSEKNGTIDWWYPEPPRKDQLT